MKKYNNFFENEIEDDQDNESEDELEDDQENDQEDDQEDEQEDDQEDKLEDDLEYNLEEECYNLKINKLRLELQENPEKLEQEEDNNISIEFKNDKDLEKIQEQYINKINNLNKNVTVTFIVPEPLIRTRVFTFYKCWRNGYCLNASTRNIPKNITKITFKKK
jgi:hypothetical protein